MYLCVYYVFLLVVQELSLFSVFWSFQQYFDSICHVWVVIALWVTLRDTDHSNFACFVVCVCMCVCTCIPTTKMDERVWARMCLVRIVPALWETPSKWACVLRRWMAYCLVQRQIELNRAGRFPRRHNWAGVHRSTAHYLRASYYLHASYDTSSHVFRNDTVTRRDSRLLDKWQRSIGRAIHLVASWVILTWWYAADRRFWWWGQLPHGGWTFDPLLADCGIALCEGWPQGDCVCRRLQCRLITDSRSVQTPPVCRVRYGIACHSCELILHTAHHHQCGWLHFVRRCSMQPRVACGLLHTLKPYNRLTQPHSGTHNRCTTWGLLCLLGT